jgi:hypothetical protein
VKSALARLVIELLEIPTKVGGRFSGSESGRAIPAGDGWICFE